jgi:hypothetical protein
MITQYLLNVNSWLRIKAYGVEGLTGTLPYFVISLRGCSFVLVDSHYCLEGCSQIFTPRAGSVDPSDDRLGDHHISG